MDLQQPGLPSVAAPQRRIPATYAAPLAAVGAVGRSEWAVWQAVLRHPLSYVLPLLLALGVLLLAQLPLFYSIDVGVEEGYGGDLPHLRGFNTAERDDHGTFRWTRDEAQIVMPGLGVRPVAVTLHFFPVSAQVYELGPREIVIESHGQQVAVLPVRYTGGLFQFYVPADLMHGGTLDLLIRTATFTPPDPNDPRSLGTPLDRVTVQAGGTGFALPASGALLAWMATAVLAWAAVLRAVGSVVGVCRVLARGGLLLTGLVVLTVWLDPPRWAFGAVPALIAAGLAYLLGALLPPLLRWLAGWLAIPLDARTLGLLVLIVAVAFGMRYGGRLYPNSMHGDIYFHNNRFNEIIAGQIYLVSRHRGVDFPYPPATYLAVAPLALLHADPPWVFELSVPLIDVLSALLIFFIVARVAAVSSQHRPQAPLGRAWYLPVALLATATYAFAPAFQMMMWWLFSTHIYTQAYTLLLIAVLVEMSVRYLHPTAPQRTLAWAWASILLGLLLLVFLGHFGFFINVTLLGGLALLLVLPLAWRGVAAAQAARLPLLVAGVGGVVLAALFFYTAYIGLFLEQAQAAANGGMSAVAQRAPVDRARLWRIMWEAGFILHYGFFPLLLVPVGVLAVARLGQPARGLLGLMLGTLLVSSVFAVLPFLTQSTHSTRWLLFAAWVVAIAWACAVRWLWRYGWSGRLVVIGMAGFVVWTMGYYWVAPMLWRIRPPEPF